MKQICPWCEVGTLQSVTDTVFWELPDGSRAVEIDETPKEIENQLFLIDTKQLGKEMPAIPDKRYVAMSK